MKIEELRHALDDLAGEEPEVDDAFDRVTGKVRKQRTRTWAGVATACVLVVAIATVGALQLRSNDRHKISVVNPSASVGNVADFKWTRVPAPAMNINRIVTADGKTLAVGSSPDGKAAIAELDANGAVTKTVNPAAGYNIPPESGSVNDLVAIPGALVAVGASVGVQGTSYADAWRSTDGGHTWSGSAVETSTDGPLSSINRVVVSNGVVYAIGTQPDTTTASHCPSNVWTSTDGTDFHLLQLPSRLACSGPGDAANGPAGLVITTTGNAPPFAYAVAWTRSGNEWSAHQIPSDAGKPRAGIGPLAGDEHGYVAVGSFATATDSGGAIWWSPDGNVWKHVLTARGPVDPHGSWAVFTGVAHTEAGWIAVGARGKGDATKALSNAMVWTSPDGEHWTENTRDGKDFEQFARANAVGATADGFAILGFANMTPYKLGDSSYADEALWLGSNSSPSNGIVEGSMQEIGGMLRGGRPIPGTLVATGADGELHTTAVDKYGRFSIELPPGEYRVTGHSPQYGSGRYTCGANPTPSVTHANTVTHLEVYCRIR